MTKQEFLCVFALEVAAEVRVDLASGTENLLAGDACRRCRKILGSRFKTRKLAAILITVNV